MFELRGEFYKIFFPIFHRSLFKKYKLRYSGDNKRKEKMVGWYHQLSGHEFKQTLGDGRTGKPGVLQFMGLQRVGHDLATKQQQVF